MVEDGDLENIDWGDFIVFEMNPVSRQFRYSQRESPIVGSSGIWKDVLGMVEFQPF